MDLNGGDGGAVWRKDGGKEGGMEGGMEGGKKEVGEDSSSLPTPNPFSSPIGSPTTTQDTGLPISRLNGLYITGLQKCFSFFVLRDLHGVERVCWVGASPAVLPPLSHSHSHLNTPSPLPHTAAHHKMHIASHHTTHTHAHSHAVDLPKSEDEIRSDTKTRFAGWHKAKVSFISLFPFFIHSSI